MEFIGSFSGLRSASWAAARLAALGAGQVQKSRSKSQVAHNSKATQSVSRPHLHIGKAQPFCQPASLLFAGSCCSSLFEDFLAVCLKTIAPHQNSNTNQPSTTQEQNGYRAHNLTVKTQTNIMCVGDCRGCHGGQSWEAACEAYFSARMDLDLTSACVIYAESGRRGPGDSEAVSHWAKHRSQGLISGHASGLK